MNQIRSNKKRLVVLVSIIFLFLCLIIFLKNSNFQSRDDRDSSVESDIPLQPINLESGFARLRDPQLISEKARKVEEARLARWKAEFPWEPTHDPKVKFIPARHFKQLEQKKTDTRPTSTDMATRKNNFILKHFFKDSVRFSPQFERFYNILNENDRGHNPAQAAGAFWALRGYYHAAIEHDPNEIYIKDGVKKRKGLFSHLTWGDVAEKKLENLRGYLRSWHWLKPEFATETGKAKALGLIHRLVSEIDGLEELPIDVMEYGSSAGMTRDDAIKLLNGEEDLLVPYVGWNEQSELYWAEQQKQFRISFENGDPSLKEAAPELFPPVGVKNGRLVDKDGDPVAWREGMEVSLVNERGEVVPAIIEEDGSIGLPTPDEVDLLRAQGKLKPANFEELHPDLYNALGMGSNPSPPIQVRPEP